jgi:hypothetical protein
LPVAAELVLVSAWSAEAAATAVKAIEATRVISFMVGLVGCFRLLKAAFYAKSMNLPRFIFLIGTLCTSGDCGNKKAPPVRVGLFVKELDSNF